MLVILPIKEFSLPKLKPVKMSSLIPKKIRKIGISLWQVQSLPCLGITTKLFVITLVAGPVLTVKV